MARAAYAAEHALYKTSPIKHVHGIAAPVLFCGANFDQLCPMEVIKRAVGLTPKAELYAVDCDHFELFTPKVRPFFGFTADRCGGLAWRRMRTV
jgi:hypothetical protein